MRIAETWFNLGNTYEEQEQTPQAVAAYRQAVRLKPDFAQAWTNLGLAYAEQKDYTQAASALGEACRLQPTGTAALYSFGIVHALRGDQAGATEVHERLRALDPAKAEEFCRKVWKGHRP